MAETSKRPLAIQEFLEARWAEAEAIARRAADRMGDERWIRGEGTPPWRRPLDDIADLVFDEVRDHIVRNDPAAVLADIAAKRELLWFVKRVRASSEATDGRAPHWHTEEAEALGHVLVLLASAYRDHPDWREDW